MGPYCKVLSIVLHKSAIFILSKRYCFFVGWVQISQMTWALYSKSHDKLHVRNRPTFVLLSSRTHQGLVSVMPNASASLNVWKSKWVLRDLAKGNSTGWDVWVKAGVHCFLVHLSRFWHSFLNWILSVRWSASWTKWSMCVWRLLLTPFVVCHMSAALSETATASRRKLKLMSFICQTCHACHSKFTV